MSPQGRAPRSAAMRPARRGARSVARAAAVGWLALLGWACMPGAASHPSPPTATVALPSGFGTLRQDDITIELQSGAVRVRLTPLEPTLIRLTAPDTEARLGALLGPVDSEAGLWVLASVQTEAPGGASFEPMGLEISSGGVVHRPLRVHALTPRWGSGQLQQRVPQQALYLFSAEVDPWRAFEVRIGGRHNSAWNDRLPLLDAERARVLARAGAVRPAGRQETVGRY